MLRLPTIRERFAEIAATAEREQQTYLGFWPSWSSPSATTAITAAPSAASATPRSPPETVGRLLL